MGGVAWCHLQAEQTTPIFATMWLAPAAHCAIDPLSGGYLTATRITVIDSLAQVDRAQWNALAGTNPVLSYDFFDTLHTSSCASKRTGWQPHFLVLHRDGVLAAAMPLYLKGHSRGEYVFDHAWAEAFQQHGIEYYPKLLSAVPFTPVTGARLLARTHDDRVVLAQAAVELAKALTVSSLHILFPNEEDIAALRQAGFLLREGVQFHWDNAGYANFEDFLAQLKNDKRKKIRQERRRVSDAGVRFRRLRGDQVDAATLAFFYQCYATTYASHYSKPYLTPGFFAALVEKIPDQLLFVIAERDGQPIASALNLVGGNVMYGRYWGALEFVSGLHFETCYLQGIEHCIEHGLARFEGGAQGVHKMSRGLVPTATWSAHWIADQRFSDAIADFLTRETQGMNEYIEELEEHTPFKQVGG